ncbi:MAG: ATP synthase subunit C [Oscillospiraceae bacterium]|nr:ATP synthase subunit C [Oscillospiraceae bacterium]
MIFTLIISLVLVLSTIAIGIYSCKSGFTRNRAKRLFGINIAAFFGLLVITTIILFSVAPATASGTAAGSASDSAVGATTDAAAGAMSDSGTNAATGSAPADNARGMAYIGAAISTGLATIGAGLAVAFTGSAALGAISEDQSLLGKSLIFVGLAEGIAIYGLIISVLILGQ